MEMTTWMVGTGDLTDDVWDFVFRNTPLPKKSKIPQKTLEKMRKEFRFWYPMDLRVSGKDLIQNHLTMALYNHACVWEKEPELWPKSFFCNGWLLVNNVTHLQTEAEVFEREETRRGTAYLGDQRPQPRRRCPNRRETSSQWRRSSTSALFVRVGGD